MTNPNDPDGMVDEPSCKTVDTVLVFEDEENSTNLIEMSRYRDKWLAVEF